MELVENIPETVVIRNYTSYAELTQQVEQLNPPLFISLRNDMETVLKQHFNEANVSIVKCPDLCESPFYLTAPGLSGNTVIMEMGGPEYLYKQPVPDAKKSWKITEIIDHFYAPKTPVFVIGAGRSQRTFNSEVATNFIYSTQRKITNRSYFNFVNKQGTCESELITNSNRVTCDQHGSFFMCNGSTSGYIFKIYAKGRQTAMNFPSVIQLALETRYEPNYFIGLGGTFVINNGIVRNEIRRPNFALSSNQMYDTFTPLVAVGTILSRPKHIAKTHLESNITVQNFNTFTSNGNVGGHFVNDITPNDIEYEGYFSLASLFIRISPPQRSYELPY